MEMKHEMIHAMENYNESKKKNLKCNMLGRQSSGKPHAGFTR